VIELHLEFAADPIPTEFRTVTLSKPEPLTAQKVKLELSAQVIPPVADAIVFRPEITIETSLSIMSSDFAPVRKMEFRVRTNDESVMEMEEFELEPFT
jgi:hypothetical protein